MLPTLEDYLFVGIVVPILGANPPLWSLLLEEILYGFTVLTKKLSSSVFIGILFIASLLVWGLLNAWLAKESLTGKYFPGQQMGPICSFLLGNLLYLNRDKLGIRSCVVLASMLLLAVVIRGHIFIMYVPFLAGLVVNLAYVLPQLPFGIPDISYGIYIYHFPIIRFFVFRHGISNLYVCLGATILLSCLSWFYIERPFLALKAKPLRLKPLPSVP